MKNPLVRVTGQLLLAIVLLIVIMILSAFNVISLAAYLTTILSIMFVFLIFIEVSITSKGKKLKGRQKFGLVSAVALFVFTLIQVLQFNFMYLQNIIYISLSLIAIYAISEIFVPTKY